MSFNETIAYGNITMPLVSQYIKVDYALDGGLTLVIHSLLFLWIVVSFYKKDNDIERGLIVAGFITGVTSGFLTIIGYLSWRYIWMSIALFATAFIAKAMEKK